jgi:hypothetical protein
MRATKAAGEAQAIQINLPRVIGVAKAGLLLEAMLLMKVSLRSTPMLA